MLAGEARIGAILVDGRRPDREGRRKAGDGLRDLFDRLFVAGGDGLDEVARKRHAGRNRQTLAHGIAEPDGLRSVERGLARLRKGNDLLHPSTVTSPASPSTRSEHAVGDALGRLAGADDTGNPVFARDDRRMRKQAAIVGDDRRRAVAAGC